MLFFLAHLLSWVFFLAFSSSGPLPVPAFFSGPLLFHPACIDSAREALLTAQPLCDSWSAVPITDRGFISTKSLSTTEQRFDFSPSKQSVLPSAVTCVKVQFHNMCRVIYSCLGHSAQWNASCTLQDLGPASILSQIYRLAAYSNHN